LKPWETQLLENSFISLTFFFTAHRKLPPRISPNNRSTTNYADLFKTNNVLSFGSQNPSFKPPDNKTLTKKHFHSNPFPFLSYASNGNFQVCGFPDAIFFLSGSIVWLLICSPDKDGTLSLLGMHIICSFWSMKKKNLTKKTIKTCRKFGSSIERFFIASKLAGRPSRRSS